MRGDVGAQWQHLLLMFIIKDCENTETYKEIENSAGATATRGKMESLGGNPGGGGEERCRQRTCQGGLCGRERAQRLTAAPRRSETKVLGEAWGRRPWPRWGFSGLCIG